MTQHGGERIRDLLCRIIDLEERQGFRNRAATGGIHTFFYNQVRENGHRVPAPLTSTLISILDQYERTNDVNGRKSLVRRIRELARDPGWTEPAPATNDARPSEPAKPVSTSHRTRKEPQKPADLPRATSLDQPIDDVVRLRRPEREKLERLGITSVREALYYVPRAYSDYSNPLPINKLKPGLQTTIVGELARVTFRQTGNRRGIVEAVINDSVAQIRVTWFNRPYLAAQLRPQLGKRIAISGAGSLYKGRLQFEPQDFEFIDDGVSLHTGRLVPVYPLTEGLTGRWLRETIAKVLKAALHLVVDPLPDALRQTYNLLPLSEALSSSHFPENVEAQRLATRRLGFDELLSISLGMGQRKRDWQSETGRAIVIDAGVPTAFANLLPFTLTGAQTREIDRMYGLLRQEIPMTLLLQGDVGSGKTAVAAAALYAVACSGTQGALMAPTEILAEQHARSLATLFASTDISIVLLTGSVKGAARRSALSAIEEGQASIVVGTHALIQEGVAFHDLTLAVVDEQHRFGVDQRASLRQKGYAPHLLAMTATPIPRSLALTVFGDLDVAVLDERPPGRHPIETQWVASDRDAFTLVREEVAAGHQAYVICPLVDVPEGSSSGEAETVQARAAVAEQRRLQDNIFPDLTVGLLHGKMKGNEKDTVLTAFRDGAVDILVATSVIEVGIDVPNATVMVVQDANRFGLAQLHQFRGRVGRGADRSYCVLVAESASANSHERLRTLVSTDDGFRLAEEDLRLRGPGEFWGTRQSGLPELRIANVADIHTIEEARRAADDLLHRDPTLALPEHTGIKEAVARFWTRDVEKS